MRGASQQAVTINSASVRQEGPAGRTGSRRLRGMEERVVCTRRPIDLRQTLGPLCHGGARDPCVRIRPDGVWRAKDTTLGPATVHLQASAATTVSARAWGPGAEAALDGVGDLVGADDDPPSLAGIHP